VSLQPSAGVGTAIIFCTLCGEAMRLKFVAPSYFCRNEEMQTYQCTACANTKVLKAHLGAKSEG
jgi:hypothetical protein